MSLDRQVQSVQHSLGGVVVGHDSLRDRHRMHRHAKWLRIQPEVDNHFLGRSRDATKVRIRRDGVRIFNFNPLLLLLFGAWGGGLGTWLASGGVASAAFGRT